MSDLNSIVQVSVSRTTKSISRASFAVFMIVDQFATSKTVTAFTRYREYSSLLSMTTDGWSVGDRVYQAAAAVFAQNPSVSKIAVGRKDAADTTWSAAMDAIVLESSAWYAFSVVTAAMSDADLTALATWTETAAKLQFIQTTDVDSYDSTAGNDIGNILKVAARERTAVIYHAAAKETEFAQAAWVGKCLPFDPGAVTWAFKTLSGVSADSLTTDQLTKLSDNNINRYTTTAGVGVTEDGKVASGEYIDVIIGIDWLKAQLSEEVFSALASAGKIPFDDSGIAIVEGLVRAVLNRAVTAGVLQSGFEVSVPKYADISQADKQSRTLPNVTFTATIEGAIHKTRISGVVSL